MGTLVAFARETPPEVLPAVTSAMLQAVLDLALREQRSWLEWPGWGFIGVCAEVLSLATLIGAGLGWLRSRRLYPPVIFEVGVRYILGSATGQTGYRVRVTNVGRSTAHIRSIYFLGAKTVDDLASPQLQWLLPSISSFEFDVTSDDIEKAWILIINGNLENNRVLRAAWYPLQEGTELALEQQRGYVRTRIRGGLSGEWQRRHPKAVGPGKDAVTLITMPTHKVQPVPDAVLEVVYTYDEVQLRRPGTSQDGDPKKWPKIPTLPK